MKGKKIIIIKPYTSLQLANMYGVSRKTFSRWIKPLSIKVGPRIGNYYQILQVEKIFTLLNVPYSLEE